MAIGTIESKWLTRYASRKLTKRSKSTNTTRPGLQMTAQLWNDLQDFQTKLDATGSPLAQSAVGGAVEDIRKAVTWYGGTVPTATLRGVLKELAGLLDTTAGRAVAGLVDILQQALLEQKSKRA